MAIYEITKDQIRTVIETSFGKAGVREPTDLQRLLREQIWIGPNHQKEKRLWKIKST